MTIALPVADGRLHSHFGGCTHFALVDIHPDGQTIRSTRTVAAPPHAPGLFPRWLREQGVETVIVGGIGQRALAIFAQHGIAVRSGCPEAPVEELVGAFLAGRLTDSPAACGHHHHDHEHTHEHGHDHCHEPEPDHEQKHPSHPHH